jgi:hypothetical protein
MAKTGDSERALYLDRIKEYSNACAALLKKEKDLLQEIRTVPANAPYKRLALSGEMLNVASNYIAINGISQSVMKTKNLDALNDARKALYKSVIYLEEVVSDSIDSPYSDYEEKLALIESYDPNRRYLLVRKLGFSIDLLEGAYGDNTKWKWSFVELEGRYAATAKNIIELKKAMANTDPESPYYESTVYHLRLAKKLLGQAADRYREKYELSTGRIGDFKMGISFLSALRRIHVITAEREEAEMIKKKLDIWTAKLDSDLKKQEGAGKKP